MSVAVHYHSFRDVVVKYDAKEKEWVVYGRSCFAATQEGNKLSYFDWKGPLEYYRTFSEGKLPFITFDMSARVINVADELDDGSREQSFVNAAQDFPARYEATRMRFVMKSHFKMPDFFYMEVNGDRTHMLRIFHPHSSELRFQIEGKVATLYNTVFPELVVQDLDKPVFHYADRELEMEEKDRLVTLEYAAQPWCHASLVGKLLSDTELRALHTKIARQKLCNPSLGFFVPGKTRDPVDCEHMRDVHVYMYNYYVRYQRNIKVEDIVDDCDAEASGAAEEVAQLEKQLESTTLEHVTEVEEKKSDVAPEQEEDEETKQERMEKERQKVGGVPISLDPIKDMDHVSVNWIKEMHALSPFLTNCTAKYRDLTKGKAIRLVKSLESILTSVLERRWLDIMPAISVVTLMLLEPETKPEIIEWAKKQSEKELDGLQQEPQEFSEYNPLDFLLSQLQYVLRAGTTARVRGEASEIQVRYKQTADSDKKMKALCEMKEIARNAGLAHMYEEVHKEIHSIQVDRAIDTVSGCLEIHETYPSDGKLVFAGELLMKLHIFGSGDIDIVYCEAVH